MIIFDIDMQPCSALEKRIKSINDVKLNLVRVANQISSLPQTDAVKGAYENILNSLDYLEDESNKLYANIFHHC